MVVQCQQSRVASAMNCSQLCPFPVFLSSFVRLCIRFYTAWMVLDDGMIGPCGSILIMKAVYSLIASKGFKINNVPHNHTLLAHNDVTCIHDLQCWRCHALDIGYGLSQGKSDVRRDDRIRENVPWLSSTRQRVFRLSSVNDSLYHASAIIENNATVRDLDVCVP